MENVYRNNPTNDAIGFLVKRKELYKSGPHYKAATRNPAYIKLTGKGDGGSATLPDHKESFYDRNINAGLKSNPSLEEVQLSYTPTEYGFKEGLSWTIKCFNRADFLKLEPIFCRYGTEISVEFGYPKHWIIDQQKINLKKFLLCTYEFNTDDEGSYIIRGSAVRASEALKKLELLIGGKFNGLFYQSGGKRLPVTGLAELMTYDAQQNGQKAIDDIDLSGKDGVTFIPNQNHSYKESPGAVCVYKASHATIFSGKLSKAWQGLSEKWLGASSVTSSVNLVYYSLEYVVNRLIMGQSHLRYKDSIEGKSLAKFSPTAITFDPKLSLSYVDKEIISGLPTQCVFSGIGRGKYLGPYSTGDELGIDFDNVGGKGPSPIKACRSISGSSLVIDPKRIIVERSVILNALDEAAKKKDSNADKINDKSEREESINVLVFLEEIFRVIKQASGGSIVLGVTQHPEKEDELVIIDQRNGFTGQQLECVVFNGIDGDGSSRSINLKSNAGSPEMASSIMAGQTAQGDAVHNVAGKTSSISSKRQKPYNDAIKERDKLIKSPANLIESRFNSDQETSLASTINAITLNKPETHIKKYDLPTYPGLELDVTLDGCYGFRIGNAISSAHLSPNYEANKAYFMVRSVIHKFDSESDWSTELSGLLTFFDNIKYIKL